MRFNTLFLVLLVAAFGPAPLLAQGHKALTLEEALKRQINGTEEQRTKQFLPYRIIGNIYYVGAETQASFLVATSQGLIVINSNFEKSVPEIKKSVEDLGFKFSDVRILLGSHAHFDHQEGDAFFKQMTGAQVMAMAEDVPLLKALTPGGKPHPIDKVLHHLDVVTLGDTTLVAHRVGGHTPGATVWTMKVRENGRNYNVVIMSGMGAQGKLVDPDGKPTQLAKTMEASFKYSRALPCDVFLGSHAVFYSMKEKYAALKNNPSLISTPQNPFIDPHGYLNEVENDYKIFQHRVEQERNASTAGKNGNVPTAAAKTWILPRLPDGHPDLQGTWDFATLTPLERPTKFEGKELLDKQDLEQLQQQLEQTRAETNDPNAPTPVAAGAHDAFWLERGSTYTNRTSLIVDPPDGKVPPLTPAAQQLRNATVAKTAAQDRTGIYETLEDIDPYTRCVAREFPRISQAYNHGVQIVQAPGYVTIFYESMHDARVIRTDGRPHIPQRIRLWSGDPRGRWEGDTLVVETTNFSDKSEFEGLPQGKMRMVERFTRVDAKTINYEVTMDDPTTWVRPWTFILPWQKADDYVIFEYACHEGNIQLANILRGSRAKEKELEDAAKRNNR